MRHRRERSAACFLCMAASLLALAFPSWGAVTHPFLLARVIGSDVDVSRYLVSEKLDGVRAFWDGSTLRTRGGHVINAPAWYTRGFPSAALDGELWSGRGTFEQTVGVVQKDRPIDTEWRKVRYMVFELPDAPGTFRDRLKALRSIVAGADVPWLRVIDQTEVGSRGALERRLEDVVRDGGEGLMLHRADAPYTTGRSDDLLKMKPYLDAEATVVGYLPGKRKYPGRLGALRVRTEEGIEFRLGSGLTEAMRRNPPPIGTIVTYRYRDLNGRGVPRFASYYRIRSPVQ